MQKIIQFYNRFYPKDIVALCRVVAVILCILFFIGDLISMVFESAGGSGISWFFHTSVISFLLFSFSIMIKRIYTSDSIKQSSKFVIWSELIVSSIALCLTFRMLIELIDVDFEVLIFLLFIVIAYFLLGIVLNDFIEIKKV
jgi:Na+/citrate or Na+/malate symporter